MLLIDIISRILSSPNSKFTWNEFLRFTPAIVSKPKREGTKRNLSNLINKRTGNWDKDHPSDSLPAITTTNNARKTRDTIICFWHQRFTLNLKQVTKWRCEYFAVMMCLPHRMMQQFKRLRTNIQDQLLIDEHPSTRPATSDTLCCRSAQTTSGSLYALFLSAHQEYRMA